MKIFIILISLVFELDANVNTMEEIEKFQLPGSKILLSLRKKDSSVSGFTHLKITLTNLTKKIYSFNDVMKLPSKLGNIGKTLRGSTATMLS